nr:lytic transglycosylase domain-containing protein [Bifidobacterium miconisargentati]
MLVTSFLSIFNSSQSSGLSNVPAQYQSDVLRAGSLCSDITAPLIAAQIENESNWDPKAESGAGAQGISQFMPDTWASVGKDGDGDGVADVWNPHDAIYSQGLLMCDLVKQAKSYKDSGRLTGDPVDLALAAYNTGMGNALKAGGVPAGEVARYVSHIKSLMNKYQASVGGGGGSVGELTPKLSANAAGIVDITGIDTGPGSTYAWGQCTWWAAIRRSQIGKPVDPYMGDGGRWGVTARSLGYSVSLDPSPGDAVSFHAGVLGADPTYGHVAIVEAVYPDGSILISEANARGVGVVSTRTFTKAELDANRGGMDFIH